MKPKTVRFKKQKQPNKVLGLEFCQELFKKKQQHCLLYLLQVGLHLFLCTFSLHLQLFLLLFGLGQVCLQALHSGLRTVVDTHITNITTTNITIAAVTHITNITTTIVTIAACRPFTVVWGQLWSHTHHKHYNHKHHHRCLQAHYSGLRTVVATHITNITTTIITIAACRPFTVVWGQLWSHTSQTLQPNSSLSLPAGPSQWAEDSCGHTHHKHYNHNRHYRCLQALHNGLRTAVVTRIINITTTIITIAACRPFTVVWRQLSSHAS